MIPAAARFAARQSIPRPAIVPASVVLVWSYAVWATSPRFTVTRPALVDDWWGITHSRPALASLLHFHYGSGSTDASGRYRPAYSAVWDFLQWHTFDAPLHLVGPNAGNIARIGLLVAAIVCVAGVVQDRSAGKVRTGIVAAAAALLVISTPATAVDLARFGTGEPLMLGGLLGGGLLALAAVQRTVERRVFGPHHSRRNRCDVRLALGLVAAGCAFVCFQTATGDQPSRYYLPGIVLGAVALAHLISHTGRGVQVVFAAVTVLVAASSPARATVSKWAVVGRAENAAVEQAARLDPARSRIYFRNFDLERRVALTKLVRLVRDDYTTQCPAGAGIAIYWRAGAGSPTAQCGHPGWIKLRATDGLATFRRRHLMPDRTASAQTGSERLRAQRQ